MNFLETYLALDGLQDSEAPRARGQRPYKRPRTLDETIRIVSDPDELYHATEAVPLFKIFSEDCLRGSVNTKANINAVCLTSDANYTIYDYPCKFKLSRKRLLADGYRFIQYDEFVDSTDTYGESEERVLGDIQNISRYVTAVYIDWNDIGVAQSYNGDFISGPLYDEDNNEGEEWSLALTDFQAMLRSLKSKGIRVLQKGSPMSGEYYLDRNGDFNFGELPISDVG